jgi:hypothetical protein
MKIDGIGSQHAQTVQQAKHSHHQEKVLEEQDLKKTIIAKAKNNITENEDQPKDSSTGVIRNLMEGHYRGVADIRLRINFYDQIKQVSTQKTIETVQNWSQDFVTSVYDEQQVSAKSVDLADQVESFLSTFKETLKGIINEVQGGQIEPSSIVSSMREAFVDLLKIESPVIAKEDSKRESPAADELLDISPTAKQQEENSDNASEAKDIADSLEHLISTFQEKLTDLESSLADLTILPPLSEPNGKGVAYDRFLKMYNEMISENESTDDEAIPTSGDGIEIET